MSIGCQDLRVHAGRRELLHVPELQVPAGATLAVLGPNGAGKSTLLRALGLLGTHRVTGQVLLDGRVATRSELRDAVAAVLQRPILCRGTVAPNVARGLRLRGMARREALDRAEPWLDALGIDHLRARDARTVSGGEAQRICIARALAVGPRVLLLDEPFTGLDAATRADLLADLRAVLDGRPAATILVTHDIADARALAQDTALEGRIRQQGPSARMLDQPTDADTARLLGFTNLFPPALTGLAHVVVARPEHCRLVVDPVAGLHGSAVTVAATLRRTVSLGTVTRIDVDTPSGSLTCLQPGDTVTAASPPVGSRVAVCALETRSLPISQAALPAA